MTFSAWSGQEQRRPQLRDMVQTVGLWSREGGGGSGTITDVEHLAESVGGDQRSIVAVPTTVCIRGRGFRVCLLSVCVCVFVRVFWPSQELTHSCGRGEFVNSVRSC